MKSAAKSLIEDASNPIEAEMAKLGWTLMGTGGGCTAFIKRLGVYDSEPELMITDDAAAPVSMEHDCVFTINYNGSPIVTFTNITVRQVVMMAQHVDPEAGRHGVV